ncbi:MAG: hypothetical protein ACI4AE_00335, partial [Candidatus Cryptobacteroides sp.]
MVIWVLNSSGTAICNQTSRGAVLFQFSLYAMFLSTEETEGNSIIFVNIKTQPLKTALQIYSKNQKPQPLSGSLKLEKRLEKDENIRKTILKPNMKIFDIFSPMGDIK